MRWTFKNLLTACIGKPLCAIARYKGTAGWMDAYLPCWNSYTAAMIGDHTASVISSAYQKGIRNYDVNEAYALLSQNAFTTPANRQDYIDGKGRRALDSYIKFGIIPMEDDVQEHFHKKEQVSRTLEYA